MKELQRKIYSSGGEGWDLYITFKGYEGSIKIQDALRNYNNYVIETFKFNDGSILTHNEVVEIMNTQAASNLAGIAEPANLQDINTQDASTAPLIIPETDINEIMQDMIAYNTTDDSLISYSDNIDSNKDLMVLSGATMQG